MNKLIYVSIIGAILFLVHVQCRINYFDSISFWTQLSQLRQNFSACFNLRNNNGGQPGNSNGGQTGNSDGGQNANSNGGQTGSSNGGQTDSSNGGQTGNSNWGQPGNSNWGQPGNSNWGQPGNSNWGQPGNSNWGQPGNSNWGQPGNSNGKVGNSDGGQTGNSNGGQYNNDVSTQFNIICSSSNYGVIQCISNVIDQLIKNFFNAFGSSVNNIYTCIDQRLKDEFSCNNKNQFSKSLQNGFFESFGRNADKIILSIYNCGLEEYFKSFRISFSR